MLNLEILTAASKLVVLWGYSHGFDVMSRRDLEKSPCIKPCPLMSVNIVWVERSAWAVCTSEKNSINKKSTLVVNFSYIGVGGVTPEPIVIELGSFGEPLNVANFGLDRFSSSCLALWQWDENGHFLKLSSTLPGLRMILHDV